MSEIPTEEAGFWKAIEENPKDKANYLAFADWLEEREDPRAKYFRDPKLARHVKPGDSDPIPTLTKHAEGNNTTKAQKAIELLPRLGELAMPLFLRLLQSDDHHPRYCALGALGKLDVEILEKHLPKLREHASLSDLEHVWIRLGPKAALVLDELMEAMGDPDEYDEDEAELGISVFTRICKAIGPAAAPATSFLIEISKYDEEHAEEACAALVAIGLETLEPNLKAVPATESELLEVRISSLSDYGEKSIPLLTKALDDPIESVSWAATFALAYLKPELVVSRLIEGLQPDQDYWVIRGSLRGLCYVEPAATEAIPAIHNLIANHGWEGEEIEEALANVTLDLSPEEVLKQSENAPLAVRLEVLSTLASDAKYDDEAAQALLKCLEDKEKSLRVAVAEHVCEILSRDDTWATDALRKALTDSNKDVRTWAAKGLGRIKAAARPAIPDLIKAMKDSSPAVRAAATATIDGMEVEKPEMLAALLVALEDKDKHVRTAAIEGLKDWHHIFDQQQDVFRITQHDNQHVRFSVLNLLSRSAEPTPEIVTYFHRVLQEATDEDLRNAAAEGLGRAATDDPQIVADLFAHLDQGGVAAKALCSIGASTMEGLNQRLLEKHNLREDILEALHRVENVEILAPTLPGVLACLRSKDEDILRDACTVLSDMGTVAAEAVPQIRKLLRSKNKWVRSSAVETLPDISSNHEETFDDVASMLKDSYEYVRERAVESIAKLNVPVEKKLSAFQQALQDTEHDVRWGAVSGLGQLGADALPAFDDLLKATSDSGKYCREYAVDALKRLASESEDAMDLICTKLEEYDAWLRRGAVQVLGALGEKAKELEPGLLHLMQNDPDDIVRIASAQALAKIGASEETLALCVQEVKKLVHANSALTRVSSIYAIIALKEHARDLVPALVKAFQNRKWGDIKKEMKKERGAHGIALIADYFYDGIEKADHRETAVESLKEIGPFPEVLEALKDLLPLEELKDYGLAIQARSALKELRPASESLLQELLEHPSKQVRELAREALTDKEKDDEEE